VLSAEGAELESFAPKDLQVGLDEIGVIEAALLESAANVDPPEAVAEFHQLFFDDTYTKAREALAARASTAADWVELSATPEMDAYRAAVARDKQLCVDVQADLDATAERAEFADTPWIPGELKEIVNAVLNCGAFPENPEDVSPPVLAEHLLERLAQLGEGNDAELLQERQVGVDFPPLGKLAVLDPPDEHHVQGHVLASRR
jgi:hypothetical protein